MCLKRIHPTRRAAKKALRQHDDWQHTYKGCRPYYCTTCTGWHLGHLPADIRHGLVDRVQVYGRTA